MTVEAFVVVDPLVDDLLGVDPLGVAPLAAVGLDAIDAGAELLVRVDRKYIVPAAVAAGLVAENAGGVAALEVDGVRSFRYESVYFDTDSLLLHREAATQRRHRFKVRTRRYVDSGAVWLEVKTKTRRGQTVKWRAEYPANDHGTLTSDGRRFAAEVTGRADIVADLEPSLVTSYVRSTLTMLDDGARCTLDRGLVCTDPGGCSVRVGDIIVETKSTHAASVIDRWLWRQGIRPVALSKYCTALAALRPDLPANKWHRTLARHFDQDQGPYSAHR